MCVYLCFQEAASRSLPVETIHLVKLSHDPQEIVKSHSYMCFSTSNLFMF